MDTARAFEANRATAFSNREARGESRGQKADSQPALVPNTRCQSGRQHRGVAHDFEFHSPGRSAANLHTVLAHEQSSIFIGHGRQRPRQHVDRPDFGLDKRGFGRHNSPLFRAFEHEPSLVLIWLLNHRNSRRQRSVRQGPLHPYRLLHRTNKPLRQFRSRRHCSAALTGLRSSSRSFPSWSAISIRWRRT